MPPGNRATTRLAADRDGLAALILGLAPGASAGEARAAFLRQLRESGFLPSPIQHDAFTALSGRPLAPGSRLEAETRRRRDEALRGEVETFAAGFFAMPVAERATRYRTLLAACSGREAIRERLRDLEMGLAVNLDAIPTRTPGTDRLARAIGSLYVLPEWDRKRRRLALIHELLGSTGPDVVNWKRAARRLATQSPALAALTPELLTGLIAPQATRRVSAPRTILPKLDFDVPARGRVVILVVAVVVLVARFRLAGPGSPGQSRAPAPVSVPTRLLPTPPPSTPAPSILIPPKVDGDRPLPSRLPSSSSSSDGARGGRPR